MSEKDGAKKMGLGVILLTVFIDLVGFSVIFPLFPAMLEHYMALDGQSGVLFDFIEALRVFSGAESSTDFRVTVLFGGILGSLYAALSFVFARMWGRLSDHWGRRRVLLITVTGTLISYVVWFFAGSFFLLVLSRTIGGIMSGNISVANAAIADVTDEKNRAKGMGMLGAAFGLGFLIGPALGAGATLIDLTGVLAGVPGVNPFSGPALVTLVLSAINLVWIVLRFKETLADENRAAPVKKRYGVLSLSLNVDVPGVNRVNFLFFVYTFAFTGMEFTLTFLATERFAYTARTNAYLFIFVGILIAVVQGGVVRRLAPKVGEKRLVLVGLCLEVPGLILVGLATQEWVMYVGLGTLTVGSALLNPSLSALVSLYTPASRQGEILGVFRSLGSLARAIGPIFAALLYFRYGAGAPYFAAAAVTILPLALASALPNPQRGALAGTAA